MKKCAVMQPSYLPWIGYFNLILNSDVFIFLDDVQYSKNSFFSRNRYPCNSPTGFNWLTVPVRRASSTQLFTETFMIEEDKWRRKHMLTLRQFYLRERYFDDFFPYLEKEIMNEKHDTLAKLNISLIRSICDYLKIEREFFVSSELGVEGSRSDRLVSFCKKFGCSIYLSPAGAADYISKDNIIPTSSIKVAYQNYTCIEYKQGKLADFVPSMSIVDLVFRYSVEECKKIIFQEIK